MRKLRNKRSKSIAPGLPRWKAFEWTFEFRKSGFRYYASKSCQ